MKEIPWKLNSVSTLRLGFMVLIAILLANCANESTPQGGKKDETPPKARRISPPDKSTHFHSDKIHITFDEFIKSSGFAQTLISPPLDQSPKFKLSGKSLTVKLKGKLRDSTTYTINFADDIADINEGNIAPNFTYVFSKGGFIDSQRIGGKVIIAKDNMAADGAIVALYPEDSTNAIKTSKPFYFSKTDKSGAFQITNIKAGVYRVFALKDQNYNYIYDQPNELIAFSDSAIMLNDTLSKVIELYMFAENKGKTSFISAKSISPGLIQLYYTKTLKSFKLESELSHEGGFTYFNTTKDTINFWYSRYYEKNGTMFLVANDILKDTTTITLKFIDKDSFSLRRNNSLIIENQIVNKVDSINNKNNQNVLEMNKPLKIYLSRPVIQINEAKRLQIYQDSSTKASPISFTIDERSKQFLSADFDKKENTNYTLEIPDSSFRDIFGFWNEKIIYKIKTNSKDGYGNFHLTLKTSHPEKSYLVRLLNAANEIVKEIPFSGDAVKKINIDNILAGNYKISVVEDTNKNDEWDTGDFNNKIQAERVYTFKDTHTLKGGWDMEVEVNF